MGLFTSKDFRIAKWALLDEYVPLKCELCSAIFVTKNRGPIGSQPIKYGKDYNKSKQCETKKHHLIHLLVDKKTYTKGDF